MEGQEKNIKKSATPAQGAGSADETSGKEDVVITDKNHDANNDELFAKEEGSKDEKASEIPEWAKEVIASNKLVIESNLTVVEAIDSFKRNAGPIILEALNEINSNKEKGTPKKEVLEINPDASYEANAKIKMGNTEFKPGDNMDHLEADKLKDLLNKGLISES